MNDEIKEQLRLNFENTAEWRRKKAEEHPDDTRNAEAAELLDKLTNTIDAVDPAVLSAYHELFDDYPDSEEHSEMLLRIGFHSWPATAEEFCRDYIANRTGG